MDKPRVLLASGSPRRKELLSLLITGFDIKAFEADETVSGLTPEDSAKEIALRKLNAAGEASGYDVVIACDTLVWLNGKPIGKPSSREEAAKMLSALSGKTHTVVSGLAVRTPAGIRQAAVITDVEFKRLSPSDINKYLSEHELLDKAGAYAIQDGIVVKSYNGSYTNVIGLPIEALREILTADGVL